MPFPSWVEGEGKDRGQFILLSDSLSSSCVSSGRGEDHILESVQKGCPVPSGVPSSALSSVRGASSQEQGLSVPVWVGRSQSCSIWLRAVAAFCCGSSVSPRGQAGLLGRLVQARQAPGSQTSCRQCGPALWSWDPIPLPHSHPCFVFSPCHQILR